MGTDPLGKRLWLGASAITLFLCTIIVGNFFIRGDRAVTGNMLGHDFLAFYTAGHFARTGQFEKIYDLDAVRRFQADTGHAAGLELGSGFGPFWNPPFFAWVFAPLSALPYRTARGIWWGWNLACLVISIILLWQLFPRHVARRTRGLLPMLIFISLPFQQAISHGQNTCVSLLVLTMAVTLWRWAASPSSLLQFAGCRRSFKVPCSLLAGLVAGLLFYKPQLGLLITVVLVLHLGRHALLGVLITGIALLLITLFSMPGLLGTYWHRMPENLHWMQEANPYLWERHVTLKALWRLLLQGHAPGASYPAVNLLWGLSVLGIASALASTCYGILRQPHQSDAAGHRPPLPAAPLASSADRLISSAILCMPLLMPFYFDYDLLLLAIPAVLLAAELCGPAQVLPSRDDRWLVRAWISLYLWSLVAPGLTRSLHIHGSVILLTAAALLQMRRTCRRDPVTIASDQSVPALAA